MILASKSPRRRELLAMLGLQFRIVTADVDETLGSGMIPEEAVALLSRKKAAAVSTQYPDELIVAADTIVVVDSTVLGKPRSEEDAFRMLSLLSGRPHTVMTAFTLQQANRSETVVEKTDLRFKPLSEAEIRAYIATGSPMDKAGAYGIQDQAAVFVEALNGDYYNVMGLPLCALTGCLRRWGVPVLGTVVP